MRLTVLSLLLGVFALTASTGCATYEFDLVEPPDLRTHIGRKSVTSVEVDPLVYRFRAVDGRLVMWIHYPTDDPIQLVGERSTVVDPRGESHPLRGQTIAPASFAKLIFPPLRPRIERLGPTFGVGVGVGVSDARLRRRHYHAHDPWDARPRYAVVYDDSGNLYYNWNGEGAIRVSLFFHRGDAPTTGPAEGAGAAGDAPGRTFRHHFTFQRRKV